MSCKILELIINSIPDVPDSVPDEEDVRVIQQMIDHRRRGAACNTGPKRWVWVGWPKGWGSGMVKEVGGWDC